MKRLVGFFIFVIILVFLFLLFSKRTKNYELSYIDNDFQIKERFVKEEKQYYFNISRENFNYDFVINHKYSTKRKIVKKINEIDKDDYKCISIQVFDYETPYICNKNDEYVDAFSLGIKDSVQEDKEIKNVDKIAVFNNKYEYYIWNGYGISSILDNKEYKFLKKESYDNNLSYKMGNYLIFADYDSTREFNKFFVFNCETKKVTEWNFEESISFNSYFMGDKDGYIYLFDKKNKIQYKLNVEKETISITSDNEGALFFDNEWDTIGLNKLVYNNVYFKDTNMINYSINGDKVYYNYQGSDKNILFDQDEKLTYVDIQNNDAFYLKKDTLYKYNIDEGKTKLLSYFEWNFSYSNKIFIFD